VRKLEKAEVVQAIQAKVAKSQIGILTDFKGLKVADMTRLRRQLQEADAELTVVKNTLLRRAGADDSPLAPLLSHATGPNALTLGYADPVSVTKVLIKFAQEKPQLVIKGGALGGQALSSRTWKRSASSRPGKCCWPNCWECCRACPRVWSRFWPGSSATCSTCWWH